MEKFKKYRLNYELSLDMYEKFDELVKVHECYDNIGKIVVLHHQLNKKLPFLKVGFGFWEASPNIYTRHCFFLLDDMVIDPTYFAVEKVKQTKFNTTSSFNGGYLLLNEFSIDNYMKALIDCDGISYLGKYNDEMYIEMEDKMLEQGMIILE